MIIYYEQLLASIRLYEGALSEQQLCIKPAIKGSAYHPGDGFMIVSRAFHTSPIKFHKGDDHDQALAAVKSALAVTTFDDIARGWQKAWGKDNRRWPSFWRVALSLSEKWTLGGFERMIWSSLYKIMEVGGNEPSEALRQVQVAACRELLKAEIALYKPKAVLLMTGMDWALPFLEGIDNLMEHAGNSTYVKFLGEYDGVPVVVTIPPERDREVYFVGQVGVELQCTFWQPFNRMAGEYSLIELADGDGIKRQIQRDYKEAMQHPFDRDLSGEFKRALECVYTISTLQVAHPSVIPLIIEEFYQLRFPVVKDGQLLLGDGLLVSVVVEPEDGERLVEELAGRYPEHSFVFVRNVYGGDGVRHVIVSDLGEELGIVVARSS